MRTAAYTSICCFFILTLGCGGGTEVPSAPVSGRVTWNGEPLETGTITFYPDVDAEGKPLQGQMVQTKISQGNYQLPPDQQATIGKNKVVITATKVVGKTKMDGVEIDKTEQYLPKQYNSESTLFLDVQAGSNEKDFELTSQ